ncbi:uncharacterized protein G2W53_008251 [Senna tora]|uniref:Uncharacterized protein n=1 Tax=Senna tora TaxID=362788 RepID=A0A834X7W7_9FABA|nr:uncharacterized protein G2W53_008251 [Senna tora]
MSGNNHTRVQSKGTSTGAQPTQSSGPQTVARRAKYKAQKEA